MGIIEKLNKLCFTFLHKPNMGNEIKWYFPVTFPTLPNMGKKSSISHQILSVNQTGPKETKRGSDI